MLLYRLQMPQQDEMSGRNILWSCGAWGFALGTAFLSWDGLGLAARRRRARENWPTVLSGALVVRKLTPLQAQVGPPEPAAGQATRAWVSRAVTTPGSASRPLHDSARRTRTAPSMSNKNVVEQTAPSE
jgi:hypothetical protein